LAKKLAQHSPRVIYVTKEKAQNFKDQSKTKLRKSGVKILFDSELEEISGLNSVEKVKIHDLDEDNTYQLFIDAVVLI